MCVPHVPSSAEGDHIGEDKRCVREACGGGVHVRSGSPPGRALNRICRSLGLSNGCDMLMRNGQSPSFCWVTAPYEMPFLVWTRLDRSQ